MTQNRPFLSVRLSSCASIKVCNRHLCQVPRYFHHLKRKPRTQEQPVTLIIPSHPDPGNHQSGFVSWIYLLGILCTYGITYCVTICVWLLALGLMFPRFTPCRGHPYFIPFCDWIMFHSTVWIRHVFVCLFIYWWVVACFCRLLWEIVLL